MELVILLPLHLEVLKFTIRCQAQTFICSSSAKSMTYDNINVLKSIIAFENNIALIQFQIMIVF